MRRITAIIFILSLLAFGIAAAAPNARDSIILESKSVCPNLTGAPAFAMRVWITNKDTIEILTLGLRESTVTGSGYALLNRTGGGALTFASVVTSLTGTLASGFSLGGFLYYNDSSPDRFLLSGLHDIFDRDATVEPPNATRKSIWEIKFRHSSDSSGVIRFDSARVVQSTGFTVATPSGSMDVPVHFVPAVVGIADDSLVHLISPPSGSKLVKKAIPFSWTPAVISCPDDVVKYTLKIAADSFFLTGFSQAGLSSNFFTPPAGTLTRGTRYFWQVKATNAQDSSTLSDSIFHFDFLKLGDADGDLQLAPVDVVLILYSLYLGVPISPAEVADMNCDRIWSAADVLTALNVIFLDQPPPCNP